MDRVALALISFTAMVSGLSACGEQATTTLVRGADEVKVMEPEEVARLRLPTVTTLVSTADTGPVAPDGAPDDTIGETIPLNKDDRPPEVRLFEAYGNFRDCLEDKGYGIDGNLTDPNNPAYQDSAYREAVTTCAARTDIVTVLREVQATRANLTPEEVETRNEVFITLRDCLVDKGWEVETTTSEIGLLEPKVFQNAEGELDERDINQCLSEQNLDG